MNALQSLRNLFEPSFISYVAFNASLYICESLKYGIFMFIFHFFLKQAASLLSKETIQHWIKYLKYTNVLSIVIYCAFGIQYTVVLIQRQSSKSFCKTFEFIVGGLLQMVLTTMFITFSSRIQEAVREQNDTILTRTIGKQEKDLLKSRQNTIRNL